MPNFGRFAITNKASAAVQQRAMELANWFYTTEGTLEMGSGLRGHVSDGFYWDWAGPDDRGLDGEPAVYIKLPPPPMSEVTNYKWHTEFRFWHKALFNSWAASQDIMTRLGYERFLVVESDKYIDHVPAEVVPGSMYFSPEDAQLTAQLQVGDPDLRRAEHRGVHHRPARHRDRVGLLRAGLRRPAPGPIPRGAAEDLRRLSITSVRQDGGGIPAVPHRPQPCPVSYLGLSRVWIGGL